MEDIAVVFHPILRAMNLAHGRREITEASKVPEDIGQAAGIGPAQAVVAVIMRILPAEEGDAARRADGILRDGILEAAAFARHPVEMRRLYISVPLMAEQLGVVLVRHQE